MSLALVHSRARAGVSAPPVRVEVHLSGGLPQTHIVGLPEAAVRESQEELQQTFKSTLQAGLSKLDLVTREEFDVQRAVLLRTREKLEALERTVAALDAAAPASPQH